VASAYSLTSDVMVQNLMSFPDAYEGVGAFLGKRHPHWSAFQDRQPVTEEPSARSTQL
jgi:hypothetical protein